MPKDLPSGRFEVDYIYIVRGGGVIIGRITRDNVSTRKGITGKEGINKEKKKNILGGNPLPPEPRATGSSTCCTPQPR